MDRRILLSLGLLGAVTDSLAQERPNIVLFLVDDMGVMDTSVPFLTDSKGLPVRYPLNGRYRTPNMERLARQGIRFSQFYAQGVSSPSRASLLTGQDAARHRTTNWIRSEENNRDEYGPYDWNWEGLRSDDPTLPRVLQAAGYRTIHVGKGHFGPFHSEGEDPLNLGFEVNVAGSSIGEPGSYLGENGYGLIRGVRSRAVPRLDKYHGTETFLTEALTLEALAQVDTAVAAGKPFFLYLSHYAVHNPFETDRRFAAHYADTSYTPAARGYATLIEGMDKSLGDVLDHLEKLGIAERPWSSFWETMAPMHLWAGAMTSAHRPLCGARKDPSSRAVRVCRAFSPGPGPEGMPFPCPPAPSRNGSAPSWTSIPPWPMRPEQPFPTVIPWTDGT